MKVYPASSVVPAAASPLSEGRAAALVAARALVAEQRALAQAMQTGRDPKHWYLRLCQLTTEELVQRCEQGKLPHASWALQLLSLLHAQFLHNLRRWQSPGLGPLEPQWQQAFTALDLVGEAWSVGSVLTGLQLCLRAQLEQDLPRAVAQTLRRTPVDDYTSFHTDMHQMSQALRSAVERLLTETTAPYLPRLLQRPAARLLAETLAFLLQRYVYDEVGQRGRALATGVQLAKQAGTPRRGTRQESAARRLPSPVADVALSASTWA